MPCIIYVSVLHLFLLILDNETRLDPIIALFN